MHGITLISALLAQPGATEMRAVCINYQKCVVAGDVASTRWFGRERAATLRLGDGRCLPLVLSRRQLRSIGERTGRAVVTGDALPRLAEADDPSIVSTAYFDRALPTGVCPDARLVLFVRRIAGSR